MLKIDEQSNQTSLSIKKLQQVELSLSENATTGFRWQFKSDGQPICRVEEAPSDVHRGAVGQGGARKWLFTGMETGVTTIELFYSRSFEPDKPPSRTFKIMLEVTE